MCAAGEFNMSYESLTSLQACKTLSELKDSNPTLYAEITSGQDDNQIRATGPDNNFVEDDNLALDGPDTSADLASCLKDVLKIPAGVKGAGAWGAEEYSDTDEDPMVPGDMPITLMAASTAANLDNRSATSTTALPSVSRVSGCIRVPNKLYSNVEWVRYDDDSVSDSDT